MHRNPASRFIPVATAALIAVGLGGCATSNTGGDGPDYPDGSITYVVPYNPGGSTDPVGRQFSALLADQLGTTAVVENRPGGDETIGVTSVVQANPDGQTMGLSSATGIIVQPLVNSDLPYQPQSGYTPIVKMVEAPNAIVVGKNSKYTTIQELIAAAKAAPGTITIGSTGRLTNNSFVIYMLEKLAGVEFNIVPFGGAGEAVEAAIGGQIDAAVPTAAGQRGLIASGDLRALAHTGGSDYDSVLPGSVSFESLGYDIPFSSDYVTVAAPDLPDTAKSALIDAALKVAQSDDWKTWCEQQGFIADPMAGSDLDDWIAKVTAASEDAIELADSQG